VPSPTTQQGLQTLFDELGAEKLLYGSDGGYSHRAVIKRALMQINYLKASPQEKEKILGKNALRLVGL
jgi:predicted TIM-barrel fold metal-dependent hydrolase